MGPDVVNIQQDFWDFIFHQPWQEWTVSGFCLIVGACAHWFKQVSEPGAPGEFKENFFTYCYHNNPRKFITMALAMIATWFTVMTTGASSGMTWPTFMYVAFSAGYLCNSGAALVRERSVGDPFAANTEKKDAGTG